MRLSIKIAAISITASVMVGGPAAAEVLAMMNYESKPADQLKSLKLSGDSPRREGIAVVDVDPSSPQFGKILMDIPIDPATVAHHIFYDRTMSKAYLTALAQPALQVIDMTKNPYRVSVIMTPECKLAEDVILDEANERWYLTCMGSGNVIVGEVATDRVIGEIKLPGTNPHGLAVHSGIDRILVTSTITPDLQTPKEVVSVVRASDLKPLGEVKVSEKPSPSGEAPVELLFAPKEGVPTAVVTNMFGHSLWTMVWDGDAKDFKVQEIFDFQTVGAGVPLEIYFNDAGDRMYITTASPGHLHIFDISNGVAQLKLLHSTPTAGGAHHVGFTKAFDVAYVQNSFLNLPNMSDGSVSIVDLKTGKLIATMDNLKTAGLNPNSLVLLPEWNAFAGH